MSSPLLSLLNDAKARLERAERKLVDAQHERDIARAQVSAFQEAALAVGVIHARPDRPLMAPPSVPGVPRAAKSVAQSDAWNRVFQELWGTYAEGFGYDEICLVADKLGVPYKRDSLRTKMMNYANSLSVQRLDSGRFQITAAGLEFFGIDTPVNAATRPATDPKQVAMGSGDTTKTATDH
jgi:hypothetical protein